MKRASVEHTSIDVNGATIPAKVYRENRRGTRFYLARKGAILRMPLSLAPHEQQQEIKKFQEWIISRVEKRKEMQEHFSDKTWKTGDTLTVGKRNYSLQIELTENKSHSARIASGVISLSLTQHDTEEHRLKAIKHLLSRLVAKDFLPEIILRVHELNQLHFQKRINSVNLKYTLSNWGSCSSKGNINLSTCLLFAPDEVIDYVIIHELAHLVEMNHSVRFWKVVEKAMPGYKEKISWLKKNWGSCDF